MPNGTAVESEGKRTGLTAFLPQAVEFRDFSGSARASRIHAISLPVPDFEIVRVFRDYETGLTAAIAVHNTMLGPALGGCRVKLYGSLREAVGDACDLASGMTYKSALAGLPLGGGKMVVLADPAKVDRDKLRLTVARCVQTFAGQYITAEDSGTDAQDMDGISAYTAHVVGKSPRNGGVGDPSPHTARGVFLGMERAWQSLGYGSDLTGVRVLIQGTGHVGSSLAGLLVSAGADVVVCDAVPGRAASVVASLRDRGSIQEHLDAKTALAVECDILSPCALSKEINDRAEPGIRARLVAGAANVQLSDPRIEARLRARNVFWVPDFALNAGGIIHCAQEALGAQFLPDVAALAILQIPNTIEAIVAESLKRGRSARDVAREMAEKHLISTP